MGKKKSKLTEVHLLKLEALDNIKCKSKCCKKYKKAERKRCSKCPCYDLLKKVA